MNPLTLRPILWASALGLAGLGGLRAAAELRDVASYGPGLRRPRARDLTVRAAAPRPARVEVAYEQVVGAFHALDWTGAPPLRPTAAPGPDVAPPPPAVSELVRILMVRLDEQDGAGDRVFLEFTARAGIEPASPGAPPGALLGVGDPLPAPHRATSVRSIELDAVTFAFTDGRAPERVPLARESRVIRAAPASLHAEPTGPPAAAWPERTREGAPGHFRLGREDALVLRRDYATLLSEELRLRRHRDPVTGRYDGVAVLEVAPGSFGARHGLRTGDVLKRLNGHPVSSLAEARKTIENLEPTTSRWEAEIENQGRTRLLIFETE